MMYLLMCVLDNSSLLSAVLDGWTQAGVLGITVLDSTGVERMRQRLRQEGVPLCMGFSRLLQTDQHSHNTLFLFAVVQDMDTVQRAVAATEAVTGDLSGPHTGVLFAVPVAAAWGLSKQYHTPAKG
jgi:nitrogen regulatory protein P-II 1